MQTVPDGQTPSIAGENWTLNTKAWYVWLRNPVIPVEGEPGEHAVEIDA